MKTFSNGFLSQLAPADETFILENAKLIKLNPGDILSLRDEGKSSVFFPISGSIALFVGLQGKKKSTGLAVGLIGAEGVAGLHNVFSDEPTNLNLLVQSEGEAYVLDTEFVRCLIQSRNKILDRFTRYSGTLFNEIVKLSSSPIHHDMKVRLVNWLLLSAQRCMPSPLVLTHSQMAQMLGISRSGVNVVLRDLKNDELISYERGRIDLLDVPALVAITNVCR